MQPLIKIDLNQALSKEAVILELGCGRNKMSGAIGIDMSDLPGVDVVADIENGLGFIPDSSIDHIYARSCFEHIRNFEQLMSEITRVLKDSGKVHVFVPHFSNPYYYSDPTHIRHFGLYSFYYFVESKYHLKRKVPDYYFGTKIRILSQKLVFDSPFLLVKILKKFIGLMINANSFFQEFYEGNFCYIFTCYGIEIEFTKDK